MSNTEREQVAREMYERLSPGQRRERFVVSPAYRSAYNRIIDSEDRMTLPRYFWRKWLPMLGAEAAALYVVLRDISRVEASGADAWCWPDQEELGRRIGVSENTLRKRLAVLEEHGFIQRKRQRKPWREGWGTVQSIDYQVFLDIPVTPADGAELLLGEMDAVGSTPELNSCAQGKAPVENSLASSPAPRDPDCKSCAQGSEEVQLVSPPGLKICAPNVRNVDNVTNVRDGSLKNDPRVTALMASERRAREDLAHEIGETIARMTGDATGGPHKSLGLHRRIAFLMPTHVVKEALMATRDAAENQRAGRATLGGDLSGYFAGIAFKLADRERIDLGVRRKSRPCRPDGVRNHGPMGPRGHGPSRVEPPRPVRSNQTASRSEPAPSDEERARVRSLLQGVIKTWEVAEPS